MKYLEKTGTRCFSSRDSDTRTRIKVDLGFGQRKADIFVSRRYAERTLLETEDITANVESGDIHGRVSMEPLNAGKDFAFSQEQIETACQVLAEGCAIDGKSETEDTCREMEGSWELLKPEITGYA